jgi:hypothetical protein
VFQGERNSRNEQGKEQEREREREREKEVKRTEKESRRGKRGMLAETQPLTIRTLNIFDDTVDGHFSKGFKSESFQPRSIAARKIGSIPPPADDKDRQEVGVGERSARRGAFVLPRVM